MKIRLILLELFHVHREATKAWLLLGGQQERDFPQNLWSQNFFSK
jgi:hypothetical protein